MERIRIEGLEKSFTLHIHGGARIPVFSGLDLAVEAGEAVALTGPSGAGKSSLLRLIYGTYTADRGCIEVAHGGGMLDVARAAPRTVLEVRRTTLGYVSQFLRVIPRVPTIDIVAEPLVERGADAEVARDRAGKLLERLNIPGPLWGLSPVTFSGGEQQRVNIARGLIADYPVLLLDEPTASLDEENRASVLELVGEARAAGAAIVAVFHSAADRDAVCTRSFDIRPYTVAGHG